VKQLPLWEMPAQSEKIVNVASVPHRSPFRYPGGKTWLVPRIRQWLRSLHALPFEFIEPFAGGAIVGLTVGFEELAQHVTLVEVDDDVAAVWQTIFEDDLGHELAQQIVEFPCTHEHIELLLAAEPTTRSDRAFQTIVKNRVNRGGILAPGAGMIKTGENGRGVASRWYPGTLKRRILDIAHVRERFCFIQGDGLTVIEQNLKRKDSVFFIDPPYTASSKKAGSRLYRYSEIDHERLFALAASVAGDFLMTYDHADEILQLAKKHGFDTEPIAMKNTHHAQMTELLIGRNLNWFRL
jgi:DNA adenine methylase